MGNQYIDAIWLLPIIVFVFIIWFVYRLGIEVGRDQMRQEARARRDNVERVRTTHDHYSNVTPIRNTK